MRTENKEILKWIQKFKQYENNDVLLNTFQRGYCYWFAVILSQRFKGEILYAPIPGHFVTKIDKRLYDITGDVTLKYQNKPLYQEEEYMSIENIVTGCIQKNK